MAKPKLALIPAAQGSKLFSVLPSSGVGDFDFSRSGKATRINSQGLIEEVANGQSRLNYPMIDGKVVGCPHHILEPARTNLIGYSEDFSNSDWTKFNSSVIANSIISPDGTLNATKLTEDTSSSTHRIYDTIITSSGVVHTQSIFAKSGENGRFLRIFRGSGTYNYAVFDLDNGTVFSKGGSNIISAKIEKYPNGWYKCSSTFTTQFSNIATYYGLQNGSLDSYIGDGTSSIYLWGAQLEVGSYPTSYIKSNSGSTTTRSAETANGSGDAATFNDSEGVLMAEISTFDENLLAISLSNGATSNGVVLFYYLNRIYLEINNSLTNVSIFKGGIGSSNSNKIALKYKSGDISMFFNGYEILTSTNAISLSGLDRINFDYGNGSYDFYGKTKQLQYFQTALTDSELEQLTSWTSFTDMAQGQLYTIE